MGLQKMIRVSLFTLLCCLFFGVTIISIAGGAIYPSINNIAGPFVCSNGEMKFEQAVYNPSPIEKVTTTTYICTDTSSGQKQELNVLVISLTAGIIYGLIAFIPVMAIVAIGQIHRATQPQADKIALTYQEALEKFEDRKLQNLANQTGSSPAEGEKVIFNNKEFTPVAGTALHLGGNEKDAAEALLKLKNLLDSGLITQMDYDQKKAEILDHLVNS